MKRRSILWMALLYVVTFGLYRVYWLIQTRREMLRVNKKTKIASPYLLLIPLVLMAMSVVFVMHTGNHNRLVCQRNSTVQGTVIAPAPDCENAQPFDPAPWSVALFYLSCALYFPIVGYFFWGYSQAVSTVTKDEITFALALLLLVLLPYGFDMLLIQEAFNKLPAKKSRKPKTATA